MKKLKLNSLNLDNAEVLSRNDLRKILGGDQPGGGDNTQTIICSGTQVVCICPLDVPPFSYLKCSDSSMGCPDTCH